MPRLSRPIGRSGPLVDVQIGVTQLRRRALEARGLDVPPPITVSLIVDTGADSTMIDSSVFLGLQLVVPTSATRIVTGTTNGLGEECDVFDVALTIKSEDRTVLLALDPFQVISRHLPGQSMQGMLGRDVLEHLTLTCSGPQRIFVLERP